MFRSPFRRPTSLRQTSRKSTRRPCVEQLEARTLLAAGDLDLNFGPDGTGKVTLDIAGLDDTARALAIQADSKIVVAITANEVFPAVVRFDVNGILDCTFGGIDCAASISLAGYAADVAIQHTDGKIVLVGTDIGADPDKFFVARFEPDGSLDSSFSGDGYTTIGFAIGGTEREATARGVAIQDDGRIVVSGIISHPNFGEASEFAVARLLPNGQLDSDFDADGRTTAAFDDLGNFFNVQDGDLAIQGDGRIVVVGGQKKPVTAILMARYQSDGSLDPSFDGDGRVVTLGLERAKTVAIEPSSGKIIVATNDFDVVRYNADGSLDSTFGTGGIVPSPFQEPAGFFSGAEDVEVMSNGKIVVAGLTTVGGSSPNFGLARYTISGQLDTTFSNDGVVVTDFETSADSAFGVAVDPLGRVVVSGQVRGFGFDDDSDLALARYDNSITLDLGGFQILQLGSALYLTGSDGPDGVVLTEKRNGDVDLSTLDGRQTLSFHDITQVFVEAGAGDDTEIAQLELMGTPVGRDPLHVEFHGGPGQDKVRVEIVGTATITANVTGDNVPGRSDPDPHIRMSNAETGAAADVVSTGTEIVSLATGPGDDTVDVLWDAVQFADVTRLQVDTGTGDDRVSVMPQPIDDNVRIPPERRAIQILINSGDGDDVVSAGFDHSYALVAFNPQPDPPRLIYAIDLGIGDDQADVRFPRDAMLDLPTTIGVNGGLGNDAVAVLAEAIVVDQPFIVTLDGSLGDDDLGIDFTGDVTVNAPIGMNLFGAPGADKMGLRLNDIVNAAVAISMDGGADPDDMEFAFQGEMNADYRVQLAAGDGDDQVRTSVSGFVVESFFDITVDLGSGQNTANLTAEDLMLDGGQFTTSSRGGTGADEVGIVVVNNHVGPNATMKWDTNLGNGTNVLNLSADGLMLNGGRFTALSRGGAGADEVGIIIVGGHIGPNATMAWSTDLGNGTNVLNLSADGLMLNGGRFTASSRGGTGADEVGIVVVNNHVGPDATMTWNTDLGNGTNVLNLTADGLMLDGGQFTASSRGGTGADEVGIVLINNHVGPNSTMSWDTNLGHGMNGYTQIADGLMVDGTFRSNYRGGTASDLVDMRLTDVGVRPAGSMELDISSGNGLNEVSVLAERLMVDGRVTGRVRGGAYGDASELQIIEGHVGRDGSIDWAVDFFGGPNTSKFGAEDLVIEGRASVVMRGGVRQDTMTAMLTRGAVAAGGSLSLMMFGNSGANSLRSDIVDMLLDGVLVLGMTGGRNNDTIPAPVKLDTRSTGYLTADLRGDAGNDDLTFNLLFPSAVRLRRALLDGGSGFDTCRVTGPVRVTGCER